MHQSDPIELALAGVETVLAQQDAKLQASYAILVDLGATTLDVDSDHLRRLSESTDCAPCLPSRGLSAIAVVSRRC